MPTYRWFKLTALSVACFGVYWLVFDCALPKDYLLEVLVIWGRDGLLIASAVLYGAAFVDAFRLASCGPSIQARWARNGAISLGFFAVAVITLVFMLRLLGSFIVRC